MKELAYLTFPVASRDEAESLSSYLKNHGMVAEIEEPDAVICPLLKRKDFLLFETLRDSWTLWWDNHSMQVMSQKLHIVT